LQSKLLPSNAELFFWHDFLGLYEHAIVQENEVTLLLYIHIEEHIHIKETYIYIYMCVFKIYIKFLGFVF